MDKETLDIQHQLKMVGDLVEHDAWGIVERSLKERIEMTQNLSDLKVKELGKEALYEELRAREIAVQIIASWLQDIAGTAEVARQRLQEEKPSYIITKE